MVTKKFIKTGESEAIDLSQIISWNRIENQIHLAYPGGELVVDNPAYIEHIHAILLSQTDTLISRKRSK